MKINNEYCRVIIEFLYSELMNIDQEEGSTTHF